MKTKAQYFESLKTSISKIVARKHEAFENIGDEFIVFRIAIELEEELDSNTDQNLENVYYDSIASIYGELGATMLEMDYLDMAGVYFDLIDFNVLQESTKYEAIFRKGRNYYRKFQILKEDPSDNKYYELVKTYLFPALELVQKAFKEGIIDGTLVSKNVKQYILIHLAQISIELNRWTEFQYYLNLLDTKDHQYHMIRVVALDAFLKNTQAKIYRSIINDIAKECILAISKPEIPENSKNQIQSILSEYILNYGTLYTGDEINNPLKIDSNDKTKSSHTKYWTWCLSNNLALNEHSIYCTCNLARKDSLRLRTSNKFTHTRWLLNFQLLIDHLKIDFENARSSYYRSLPETKISNGKSTLFYTRNKNLILDKKSRLLIDSFKMTYSILDRIAIALIMIFDDVKDKNMYFHDFIDYIKKNLDFDRNTYLITLHSLAIELHPENKSSSLKDFKIWRDAIEHNYFFLSVNGIDQNMIKDKYKNCTRITIVEYLKFEKVTMHLMQLCRSSIFSLVYMLRTEGYLKKIKNE